MKISNNIKAGLNNISSIILNEFKTISGSFAIVLVLMGGIFMYGLLYNYMYAPDVVRNVRLLWWIIRNELSPRVYPFAECHSAGRRDCYR